MTFTNANEELERKELEDAFFVTFVIRFSYSSCACKISLIGRHTEAILPDDHEDGAEITSTYIAPCRNARHLWCNPTQTHSRYSFSPM